MSDSQSQERLEIIVRGTVQGVGFRWFVVRRASELGLVGWTSNEPDGSVQVVAEGPAQKLDELQKQLNDGPAGADVTSVDATRLSATGEFTSFGIRSRAHRGD